MKTPTKKKVAASAGEARPDTRPDTPNSFIAWQEKWKASIPAEADKELRQLLGLAPQ